MPWPFGKVTPTERVAGFLGRDPLYVREVDGEQWYTKSTYDYWHRVARVEARGAQLFLWFENWNTPSEWVPIGLPPLQRL